MHPCRKALKRMQPALLFIIHSSQREQRLKPHSGGNNMLALCISASIDHTGTDSLHSILFFSLFHLFWLLLFFGFLWFSKKRFANRVLEKGYSSLLLCCCVCTCVRGLGQKPWTYLKLVKASAPGHTSLLQWLQKVLRPPSLFSPHLLNQKLEITHLQKYSDSVELTVEPVVQCIQFDLIIPEMSTSGKLTWLDIV